MNTIALTSRARIAGLVAAAGITTLVGTLAAAGSAGATADPFRMTVTSTALCDADGTPTGVDLFYDDHSDGHVPQSVEELVARDTPEGSIAEWTGGGLYQEGGNYFNRRTFNGLGIAVDPNATYTYLVTISYDDGVTQTNSTSIDLSQECTGAAAPTTTEPPAYVPRFEPSIRAICGSNGTATGIEVGYDDFVDGHVPQTVLEEVRLEDGSLAWSSDDVHQVNGDHFDTHQLSAGAGLATFDPNAIYNYQVFIAYEDGSGEFNAAWVTPGTECTAVPSTIPATTTTNVPGGTLPETGSNATWVIGALAGLLTTAGTALAAGTRRRSRAD